MKTAILTSIVAGAVAFSPVPRDLVTVALMETANLDATPAEAAAMEVAPVRAAPVQAAPTPGVAFDDDIGATAPLGFFDPLALVSNGDQANFDKWRDYELTHGRVSMLATVGWLATAKGARLPGMEGAPFGFKALSMSGMPMEQRGTVPLAFMTVFLLTCLVVDATGEGEFVGDFRNGLIDFGWDRKTDEWKFSQRSKELNNGRLAMIGIAAIMVHELLGNLNALGLPQP